jgi:outer membrane lipoprotein-sorting protein
MPPLALSLIPALALVAAAAAPAAPTADELMKDYDAVMGPTNYTAVVTMTAHRDDGTSRAYTMRMLKAGDDKFRIWFDEPASVRGQEILRQGDNSWLYLPNLKRAARMANRDSFQGGDFNNADVLRVNYVADYTGALGDDPAHPDAFLLELKAKTPEASYDRIKLWLSRDGHLPLKGEYYTSSGKLLRTAEFSEVKDFGGLKRPAHVLMKNMIVTARSSELTFAKVDVHITPVSGRFVLDDLGK